MHNAVQARQAISNLLLAGMLLLGSAGLAAAAESPALGADGTKGIKNSIDMELILIPSGSFQMGADKNFESDAEDSEGPRHSVAISTPFYMGKYEVTQEQWSAIMGSNPSKFKGRTRPVEMVSWDDVQKFITALNQKEGKHYRLPTEAEWEYAARAGTKTAYFFGDDKGLLSQYAWFKGNSGQETHPVGMMLPNAWGLYDMHGNVREWCQDWYDGKYYGKSPGADPSGPSSGSNRVIRGGSWGYGLWDLRTASRVGHSPGDGGDYLGFRLVLPAQQMAGSQAEKDQQAAAGKVKQAAQAGGVSVGQMAEAREKERLVAEKAAEQAKNAAAERASQQQPTNRCAHVYVGKTFMAKGGPFRTQMEYQVFGLSPESGKATIGRESYRTEVDCSQIP